MSIWLGPPDSQNRMTAFLSPEGGGLDAARPREFEKAAPVSPAMPACKNHRRDPTWINGCPQPKLRQQGLGHRHNNSFAPQAIPSDRVIGPALPKISAIVDAFNRF